MSPEELRQYSWLLGTTAGILYAEMNVFSPMMNRDPRG